MRVDGKLICELRNQKLWSQDELAMAAGLNLRTIQRMENVGTASLQSLKAVASALEIESEELKYPGEGYARRSGGLRGIRRRSSLRIGGLPLYDIALGPDPERDELWGHAKGVVAIGNSATGWFALGGMATGGIAIGGASFGLISFGGFSLGVLIAIGGLAIGTLAVGGAAGGFAAVGGGSIGYYSCGAATLGKFVANPNRRDASIDEFLGQYGLTTLCPGGTRIAEREPF